MNWKEDPNLLSVKILERIEATEGGTISYSELEKIAIDKNIDLFIFDTAITKLHRFKKITQRTKGDDIVYKAVPKPIKKTYSIPSKPTETPEMIKERERCCGVGVPIPFYEMAVDGPFPVYGPEHDKWLKEKMAKEKEERQQLYYQRRNFRKNGAYRKTAVR